MEKIKRNVRKSKVIFAIIPVAILLLNFCFITVHGFEIWNGILLVFALGTVTLGLGTYAIIGHEFCWIEITPAEIILMNLKGNVLSFSTGDVRNVAYGLMYYKLYFWSNGKQQIVQCPLGVRVYKNGERHRGIWIDDFPQAKFEDM